MKKLMIAAAMVCAAAVAQAATYNWSVSVYATPDGGDTPLNATAYAFDANAHSLADITLGLTSKKMGAGALDFALTSVAVDQDTGLVSMSGGPGGDPDTGLTGTDATPSYANMYLLFVGTSGENQYFYSKVFPAYEITKGVEGGAPMLFGDDEMIDTGAIGGEGWTAIAKVDPGPGPEPTPEPTSAMLMLLGVAGLALKRKAK